MRLAPREGRIGSDDAAEDAFVQGYVAGTSYIGASDSLTEGPWLWADGNTTFWQKRTAVNLRYTHWAQQQPNASNADLDCDPTTNLPVYEKVRNYSIDAYPRRNGQTPQNLLHPKIGVRRAAWDFAKWPSNVRSANPRNPPFYDRDQDYAVLRLKAQPNLEAAHIGIADPNPDRKEIEIIHYPIPGVLGYGLYDSIGDTEGLASSIFDGVSRSFVRTYHHSASTEKGSSGGGIFDSTISDTVIGMNVAHFTEEPDFNHALMLTPDMVTNISTWLATFL